MKRLAFIVTFLVGTAGAVQWLSRGFDTSWEPRLRASIESNAGRITHTRVHIDSIAPAFFHRIRLVNVRVNSLDDPDHPLFQASDIELTVSLIDLPRAILHRQPYEAIGLVSVKNPWVRLSPEILSRHSSQRSSASLPPWFTLAWEGGTLQWIDPRAPRGVWTLYQAQGAFRIRGPQMNFAVRGSAQEAGSVRFQFSRLGRRWNSQVMIAEAQCQNALVVAEKVLQKPLLPKGWSVRGGFHLEAQASSRSGPRIGDDWARFLDQATLTFLPAPPGKKEIPSVGITGTLTYKKGKIAGPHLTFDTPWLEGTGKVETVIQGTRARPEILLNALLPSGKLWNWPFQEAVIQTRYVDNHWEFLQNSFHFLDGRVEAKGTVAATGSDLVITADHVSLATLGQSHGIRVPEGRLNVSSKLTGPFEDWRMAGAWWLTGMQWGQTPVGDARGDFDVSSEHFQAQAKSDNARFRFVVDGNWSEQTVDLNRLELHLPSEALLRAEGRMTKSTRRIQGTVDASKIAFPADLPFLPVDNVSLKGQVEFHGQVTGTAEEPVLKGSLQSADLAVGTQFLGKTTVNFLWDKTRLEIPAFHVDPGIDGTLTIHHKDQLGGTGSLKMQNALIGKWPITQGSLRWDLKPEQLDISELHLKTAGVTVDWKGMIHWRKETQPPAPVLLEGPGRLRVTSAPDFPEIPFDLSGQLTPRDKRWSGHLAFNARVLEGRLKGDYKLSETTTDHAGGEFTAILEQARWRAFQFTTQLDGRWGPEGIKPLLLKGHVKNGGDFQFNGLLTPQGEAQGSVKLTGFNLRPLAESLRFPKSLDGSTSATLTLSGPLARLQWNGHVDVGPLVYAGESDHPFNIEQVTMDMTLAPAAANASIFRLSLTEGQAKTAEELIRFRPGSFIEFAGEEPARLSLGTEIRNLHLGLFTLFGGLDLDGTWQIKPKGFAIQTKAQTHSLFINDYELEEGILHADYYNGVLTFSAPANTPSLVTGVIDFHAAPQLKFTDFYISGKDRQGLQLSGDVGPSLWDFRMVGRGLDMGILGELAGFPYPLSGAADVQVHGTGNHRQPHIDGKVELDRGTVLGLSFRSGSAAFIWQNSRITFTKLFLSDPGHYNLEGSGAFPLIGKEKNQPQDHSIDFSVRLKDSNLSLLQSFSHEVKSAKGPVEGLLQIKGTLEDPVLNGSLHVANGEILGAHYFRLLRNANLHVEFQGDTINIQDLRGKSGEGVFQGSGTITLAGFRPAKYDLHVEVTSSKGVEIQVPELAIPESPLAKRFKFLTTSSRCDVRGQMILRGPAEAPVFSGRGLFSNGHFTFPPSRKNPPSPAILDWFRRIFWDVNLTFQEGAWFENELVQANVAGTLTLKGPSDKLRVDGGLEITEGKISYLGLQFDIQQARYDIRSEVAGETIVNTPYVRGVAESEIQAVDTVTGVSGSAGGSRLNINDTITLNIDYAPVDQIKPRLTSASNPTMSQEKLLARVTGTDTENLTPQERNYLYQKQLVSLIDSSLTTPLAQNVLKKTGIANRVRVQQVFDANIITSQNLNSPAAVQQQQSTAASLLTGKKYTIEKDLSNRLSLGYGVRFVQSTPVDPEIQQQKLDLISDVQLSYRWFRNIYLRGDFELPSANPNIYPERKVTIEPRWRFGWWGNTNQPKPKKKADQP